ncbi:MAG: type II secretion system protein [Verrucomicrobia bacterium]|nr:type II secretion system protein [Verrucomicrobiota bacterium]
MKGEGAEKGGTAVLSSLGRERDRAFTLIEMIGVLALVAILAGLLAPNIISRIQEARRDAERQTLQTLADNFRTAIRKERQVPAAANWVALVAGFSDLAPVDIATNRVGNARAFLVDPDIVIGPAASPGLPYVQGADGSQQPQHARFMIVSSTWRALPSEGLANFDALWDRSYGNLPSNWPSSWEGRGRDLHVIRINVEPLFHRIVLSNLDSDHAGPYSVDGAEEKFTVPSNSQEERWYLESTRLDLYTADDELQAVEYVNDDASYFFANAKWGGEVRGSPDTQGAFRNLVDAMLAAPLPASILQQHGILPRAVLNEFYTYMWFYTAWAEEGFPNAGDTYYELQGSAARLAGAPSAASSGFMFDLTK